MDYISTFLWFSMSISSKLEHFLNSSPSLLSPELTLLSKSPNIVSLKLSIPKRLFSSPLANFSETSFRIEKSSMQMELENRDGNSLMFDKFYLLAIVWFRKIFYYYNQTTIILPYIVSWRKITEFKIRKVMNV